MKSLETILSSNDNRGISFDQLKEVISDMILNDFEGLVNVLYRIDVDEAQLREMLANHNADSAEIIANAILKRLEQKRLTRQQSDLPKNIPEDERW